MGDMSTDGFCCIKQYVTVVKVKCLIKCILNLIEEFEERLPTITTVITIPLLRQQRYDRCAFKSIT